MRECGRIPYSCTEEYLIIGMDWMNTVVDSIKVNPYDLVFKGPIDIVNTDEED